MENFQNEEKDKRTESEEYLTKIKTKSLDSLKSKVAYPPRFMAIHIRIISILVIVAKIIIRQERENISLMKKFQENLRK